MLWLLEYVLLSFEILFDVKVEVKNVCVVLFDDEMLVLCDLFVV